jgi:hypothetical protein
VPGATDTSFGLPGPIVDIIAVALRALAWNLQLWTRLRGLRRQPCLDLRRVPGCVHGLGRMYGAQPHNRPLQTDGRVDRYAPCRARR